MNTIFRLGILFLLTVSGLSCSTSKPGDVVSQKSTDQLCSEVNKLINQHQQGFDQQKGRLLVSNRMDIWQAKLHLVGNDCEIWRWSDGKLAYMCSQVLPEESAALEKYNRAIEFTRQCLGNTWKEESIERQHGRSFRAIFSQAGSITSASVHRIKTEGLFKSEWTVYFFIGNRDQSL